MKSFIAKLKDFGHSFVFYFTHIDAAKIVSWVQYAFVAGVTITLTILSRYWFYLTAKSKQTFQVYLNNNRPLFASYTVCAALTFLFLTALIAWGVGTLVKKKFNIK